MTHEQLQKAISLEKDALKKISMLNEFLEDFRYRHKKTLEKNEYGYIAVVIESLINSEKSNIEKKYKEELENIN